MNKFKLGFSSAIILVFLVMIWWFYPDLLSQHTGFTDQEKLGQYGDAYGSLNTFFTGLAMAGAFIALYVGNEERKYKQFEDHFFQQLDGIKNIISGLQLFKGTIEYRILNKNNKPIKYKLNIPENVSGRLVFIILKDNFNTAKMHSHRNGNIGKYEDFYEDFLHRVLGHYFRAIYNTIKYVDTYPALNKKQKIFYVHMLRAQISSDELYFLFYSGLSKWGNKKFKPLIEKYNFFEHLHNEINAGDLDDYNKKAYGNNQELIDQINKENENQRKTKASHSLHKT